MNLPARIGGIVLNVGALPGAALVSAVLSLLWWRADTNQCVCEHCPDLYCDYSARLYAVITRWDPATLQALDEFSKWYTHAHSPLTPVLQALLSLIVPHPLVSYMLVSAIATLVTWLLLRRIVMTAYAPSPSLLLFLGAGFFTHVLVVRAFARPLTDAVGMACIVASLWALERYHSQRTTGRSLALAVILALGLFSRVSFFPMLGLPALVELVEPGGIRQRLRRAVVSGLLHGLGPGLLFWSVNGLLGTLHLAEAWAWAHDPGFTRFYSLSQFLGSVTAAGQGYAILLLASVSRVRLAHPTFRLHLAWVGLYLAFLASGGGALWPRYFLPIVPSLFVLIAPVLADLRESRPWNLYALILVFVLGNVLFVHPITYDLRLLGRVLLNDVGRMVVRQDPGPPSTRLAQGRWHVTASHTPERASRMADGNWNTGWPSGAPQRPGMYVQVDLGGMHRPTKLAFGGALDEYPRRSAVDISSDGSSWIRVAKGRGIQALGGFLGEQLPRAFIPLPGLPARYLRIMVTKASDAHWSINEIDVEVLTEE